MNFNIRPYQNPGVSQQRVAIGIAKNKIGESTMTDVMRALLVLDHFNDPPVIFQQNGKLVRLRSSELEGTYAEALDLDKLKLRIHEVSDWYTYRVFEETDPATGRKVEKETGINRVTVPNDVARMILAMSDYGQFPTLRSVAGSPCFVEGGRLVERPGIDRDSGVYYAQPKALAHLAPIPVRPTPEAVADSAYLLMTELLGDFKFVTPADRTQYLGLMLLTVCREMIEGPVPFHLIQAVRPGSGKSLLAEILTIPTTGAVASITPEPNSKDEMLKNLVGLQKDSSKLSIFDNLTDEVGGSALAAFLTSHKFKGRILGGNDFVHGKVRLILVGTANSPLVGFDMRRRVVTSTIDPGVEHPERRTGPEPGKLWRHKNLKAWALEHHADLLRALLIIVRNWVAQGMPNGKIELGSFYEWSRTIGGILEAAGIPDFLANIDDDSASDPSSARWRALVGEWVKNFGYGEQTVHTLHRLIREDQTLSTLFSNILGGGTEPMQYAALDGALRAQIGMVWAGHRIEGAVVNFMMRYRLEPAPEPAATPDPSSPVPTEAATPVIPEVNAVAEDAKQDAQKFYPGLLDSLGGDRDEVRRFGDRLDADEAAASLPPDGPGEKLADKLVQGLVLNRLKRRGNEDPRVLKDYMQWLGVFVTELAEADSEA